MEDQESVSQRQGKEPRSVGDAVERLFEGANDALTRAANARDTSWEKFYFGQAAAYQECGKQMKTLAVIRSRINEQAATFRRRFDLPRPDRAPRKPLNRDLEQMLVPSEPVTTSSEDKDP